MRIKIKGLIQVLPFLLAASLAGCAGAGSPAPPTPAPPAAAKANPTAAPAGAAPTAAAPAASPTSPAKAAPLQKVQLGIIASVSDAGNWIALSKGYFREQGLDVETHTFTSASDMIAPLGTGQLDVGGGAPGVGLTNAIARGIDIRIVADKGSQRPGFGYQALMVRKDLYDSGQIRGPADLKGRKWTISSTAGIPDELILNSFVKPSGFKVRDIDLTVMPFGDVVTAFANKSVDGGTLIEPFATQIVANGDGVILARADTISPNHETAVILYAGSFIKDKPDLARKFMVAYLKGVREYNDAFVKKDPARRAEVIDLLSKSTSVKNKALYDQMVVPGINPDGEVNTASLKEDQDYFLETGFQKEPVDLDKVVDNSFAQNAVKQLGGPYK